MGRFLGTAMDATSVAFCQDYIGNVQEEYLGRIESTRALLERGKAALTMGKQWLATAAAAVAASETNNDE